METQSQYHIYISDMTCAQCPTKIQTVLLRTEGITQAVVSLQSADALITCDSTAISEHEIIRIIQDLGYTADTKPPAKHIAHVCGTVTLIAVLFIILQMSGLLQSLAPSQLAASGMGYGALFLIGVTTSLHCIAMCGGINLSQSIPNARQSRISLRQPLLYNAGRVISYTLIGAILGTVGCLLGGGNLSSISAMVQGMIKLLAGIFLLFSGLQTLGLLRGGFRLPQVLERFFGKAASRGRTPFTVGLLNGLMPCGPLQSMWLVALASAHPLNGALSMLFFALGTVPLMLGFGSIITVLSKRFTEIIRQAGAMIVAVMGLAMLMQGHLLLGMLRDAVFYSLLIAAALLVIGMALPFKHRKHKIAALTAAAVTAACLTILLPLSGDSSVGGARAILKNGRQIVTSTLQSGAYPEITVQCGIPVSWTITADAKNINGCNGSIISTDFDFTYTFQPGENVIEFTPDTTGDFIYTCWMGMIKGTIHVVDEI